MLRRFFARAVRASVAILVVVPAAHAEDTARGTGVEPVRVVYDAPDGCPSSDAFLGQVRTRVGTAWEAGPAELARTIQVHVESGPNKSVARIEFVDENRQPIRRTVSAPTCDEVVSGIALVTALAIESRVSEAVGKSDPESGVPDESAGAVEGSAPAPSSGTSAPAAPAAAPVPTPTPKAARANPQKSNAHSESTLHVDLGTAAAVANGIAPKLAWGPRGFVGLGWKSGADVRLGFDALASGTVTTKERPARFSEIGGRVEGCPIAVRFSAGTRLLPCAGAELGALHASGEANGVFVEAPESHTQAWVAPFAALRFDAAYRVLFVEVEAAVRFPLYRRDFIFQTTGAPDVPVYTIPPVALGASFGVGVRL